MDTLFEYTQDESQSINYLYDEPYMSTDNNWEEEIIQDHFGISDLYDLCLEPSLRDGFSQVIYLLMWCIFLRGAIHFTSFYPLLCHLLSICVGVINLQTYFNLTMWYILLLAFIGYITLYLVSSYLKKHRGPILGITCFSFLIFCEFYLVEEMEWHKIRGAQMLLVMRIISIAFDTDFGTLEHVPSPFEFMGYICCCGTCIFGPWIPYKNYISLCDRTPLSYKLFVKIAVCLVISFFFLSLSTCWLNWLIPDGSWRWLIAYRDAFAFRSSHYFISFLSEASAMISGFGKETDSIWSFVVTSPLSIEAPRSLVEVVIYWNRPMHYWFKTYVFRSTRPLGSVAAVLSTYIVSILMHGLNFQLAAVLFSLGVYTYVEFTLRHKLAQVFDACIEAHPCRQRCSHRHKAKQLSTKLANVGFGILTMFHLSYLGVMFDMSSTLQEKGYSYSHTLSKWSNLHFASLWVVIGTYIFYLLI